VIGDDAQTLERLRLAHAEQSAKNHELTLGRSGLATGSGEWSRAACAAQPVTSGLKGSTPEESTAPGRFRHSARSIIDPGRDPW